jgi:pectate lyase
MVLIQKIFAGFFIAAVIAAAPARAEWPTDGGDKGAVIHVTSLEDAGPGTLRAALLVKDPRRIVFDVGGDIFLKSPLRIASPFVTVAGETAPEPGITLLGDKVHIRTNDVILRNIRVRIGERPGSNPGSRDGIAIEPLKGKSAENILIDRCSVAWALDENIGFWGEKIGNIRIRNSVIAEALRNSIHPKGAHSMGMLVSGSAKNVVIEKNLFAHNVHRNPAIDAGATAMVVNNLIYDPIYTGFHIYKKKGRGPTLASVVGNVVIAGPSTKSKVLPSFAHGFNEGSRVYYSDNKAEGVRAFLPSEKPGKSDGRPAPFVEEKPVWLEWLDPMPVDQVASRVLAEVGPRPLDTLDQRIIREAEMRTGTVRDTPTDSRLQVPRPLAKSGG